MTEEEKVAEQNEVIALFDGWICVNGGWRKYNGKQLESFHKKPLNYHLSWDWLMPIVEKIESLFDGNIAVEISGECCQIEIGTQYAMAFDIHLPETFFERTESKINSVYLSVLRFIQWYNQQSTDHQ